MKKQEIDNEMDTSLIRDHVTQEEIEQRVQLQLDASNIADDPDYHKHVTNRLNYDMLEMMHHSGVPVIRHLCTPVFLIYGQRYYTISMALRPPELEYSSGLHQFHQTAIECLQKKKKLPQLPQ